MFIVITEGGGGEPCPDLVSYLLCSTRSAIHKVLTFVLENISQFTLDKILGKISQFSLKFCPVHQL